ncbi:uncharacterized protein LOC121274775, partial [Carcharodon carcharias]|uniref:uncharacterized protein LOC121274775 n=1 Tax=Carcharodon carcharias TaxID=13397 RepID=UPI001B7DBDD8
RSDFLGFQSEQIVRLLFQVCEALLFLHSQGYIHRSLTSHAVQLVTLDLAKISNLEYLLERPDGITHNNMSAAAIPYQLYNWLPPEIIWGRVGTVRSDIYSFCTVIQEAFTDTVPWSGLDGLMVKEMLLSGRSLSLDHRVPTPLHSIVQIGTCLRQRDRTLNLQDIRFTLRNQLQTLGLYAEAGARWTLSCELEVPWMSSQGRVSPRIQTRSMDAVDGWSPVKISCQSEASPDSTETEGMCYYEVDHSSSQSYYSTYSQYQGSDARVGSPATTAPPGLETHTPHGKTENRAQLTPNTLTALEVDVFGDQGLKRKDSVSPRSVGSSGCDCMDRQSERRRERVRVYSVRYGQEIELESDSSLLLESVSESSPEQRDAETQHLTTTSPSLREQWAVKASDLPSVPHGPSLMQRPQSQLLHHARSIQESASLLEWANSSLERMERRFISSIQTLDQFTGRQWESAEQERKQDQKPEQELEQSRRSKNPQLDKAAGLAISGAEFCCVTSERLQDMTNRSAPLPRTEEQQTLDTTEFPSCSGAYAPQGIIVQDAVGAVTACELLDRRDSSSSKQTTSSLECKLLTFNLMQEIIDELRVKRNPTAGDNINVVGGKDSHPSLSHTHQTQRRCASCGREPPPRPGGGRKAALSLTSPPGQRAKDR